MWKQALSAYVIGLIFSLGLTVSSMIDPQKILNFLDLFGAWDPSLLIVMAVGLLVTGIGYRLALKRPTPLFSDVFQVPTNTAIDRPLILGATLFGIGWGLSGLCPGPALAGIGLGYTESYLYLIAMICGMLLYSFTQKSSA